MEALIKTVINPNTTETAMRTAKMRPAVRKSEDVFQWVVMCVFDF